MKRRTRSEALFWVMLLAALLLLYGIANRVAPASPPPAEPRPRIEIPPPQVETPPLPLPEPEPVAGCPAGCTEPLPGCEIKGNISKRSGEQIYHLPGQQYYGKTVISPDKGERWFCTEEEALDNGWRRAKL